MRRLIPPFLLTAGLLTLAGCRHKADLPPSVDDPTFGHRHVFAGMPCSLSVTASDPDSDEVAVRFSWGDGDTSDWSAHVPTGSRVAMAHTWQRGTYDVRAQARDRQSEASSWFWTHHMTVRDPYPDSLVALVPMYISEGTEPVFSPDGSVLYVPCDGCISVVRTADNAVLAIVSDPIWGLPRFAPSPDGAFLYIVDEDDSVLHVVRTSDYQIADSMALPASARCSYWGITAARSGDRAYLSCDWCDSLLDDHCGIAVLDLPTRVIITRIEVMCHWSVVCDMVEAGDYLFATTGDYLYRIRTSDCTMVDSMRFDAYTFALSADARHLYGFCGCDRIRILDLQTMSVVDSVETDNGEFTVLPDESYLFYRSGDRVDVLDLHEHSVVDSLSMPNPGLTALIAAPDGQRVYGTFYNWPSDEYQLAVYGIAQDGQ